tara:strand:- start:183 stop:404 length:222 start_codon:yes stop_codon:yes gene_type:complete
MKKLLILIAIVSSFSVMSCNKKCDCQNNWDPNINYYSGDLVYHNGICWKAFAQGGGSIVEPGTTGGDIWKECN